MGPYAARRLLHFIPVVFLTSILIFVGMRLAPGDPAQFLAGPDPTPEVLQALRERLGLNRNLAVQYLLWLQDAVRGDLGLSHVNGLPVSQLVGQRLAATLELAVGGMLLSVAIGGTLGIVAGLWPNSAADRAVSAFASLGMSVPVFWTGILLIMGLGVELRWLPVGGRAPMSEGLSAALLHLSMPCLALGLANAPIIARFLRNGMLENRTADHVRTARAKGLPEFLVIKDYVVRNSLIPVVTASGIILGNLIGGSALVEIVFAWPGLGALLVSALGNRDYSVVQGVMLVAVGGFLLANLTVDILYGVLDPRIRRAQGS